MKEIISLLSEADVGALKRNVKLKGVPAVLENKLIALHRKTTSEKLSGRKIPYSIVETCGDLSSSKIPVDISSPELVIADLTTSPEWQKATFEGLFKVLFSLFSKCQDVKFVMVVYLLPTAILDFLSSFQKFEKLDQKITFQYFVGIYEPDKLNEEANIPVHGQGFLKVRQEITNDGDKTFTEKSTDVNEENESETNEDNEVSTEEKTDAIEEDEAGVYVIDQDQNLEGADEENEPEVHVVDQDQHLRVVPTNGRKINDDNISIARVTTDGQTSDEVVVVKELGSGKDTFTIGNIEKFGNIEKVTIDEDHEKNFKEDIATTLIRVEDQVLYDPKSASGTIS
ncbi:hypothetical protein R1sor_000272 [Riccia sorocarpa]|uniref:Uncharacterized protein n=1 Tax=Riccia sorocarpa TaxID=122646 RepID=A0ABD3GVS9_9MARC